MNHQWIWFGFAIVFGAVFGSFINVIIYRLPSGISLLNPRFSFCPKCRHSIAWWENIPILAWFYLRAKCTVCRQSISPMYPIIESLTATLFGLVYWAFYLSHFRAAGFDFGAPGGGLVATWPVLLVYLTLLVCMIAATVIDAKLYIIPLQLPWIATATAAVVLPLGLLVIETFHPAGAIYYLFVSPAALGMWLGAAIGGGLGLVLALVLMHAGILPQSFIDDDAAHDAVAQHPHPHIDAALHSPAQPLTAEAMAPHLEPNDHSANPSGPVADASFGAVGDSEVLPIVRQIDDTLTSLQLSTPTPLVDASAPAPPVQQAAAPAGSLIEAPTIPASSSIAAPAPSAEPSIAPVSASPPPAGVNPTFDATELVAAPSQATPAVIVTDRPSAGEHAEFTSPVPQNPEELDAWLSHPHLDREIAKECLFVALPLLGFVLGALLYRHWINPVRPPLIPGWIQILGGVACGYLVGGGLIWITRIVGTFAFRKEAMGLGDIHLLAAIGAVMGPTDAALVFFIAPFLGLTYAATAFGFSRILKGQVRIIPYGPYLAIAAVMLMVFERVIWGKIGLG